MSYRYEYDGRTFTSDRWRREMSGSEEYEPFGRAEARLRNARPLYCFVNPDKPDEAILERRSEGWPLIVFGMGFFLVGVGVILIGRSAKHVADATVNMEATSPRGTWLLSGAFVSVFLAGGLFVGWQGISACITESRAKTWPETPCEVIRARWGNESGHVLYRYTVSGEAILCDRVRPAGGMTSNSDAPRWKRGAQTTCRVDPSDPGSAVLLTESKGWGAILFSIPFLTVGLFGWGAVIYGHRKSRRKNSGCTSAPAWLRSGPSRWNAVGILTFVNLFWNGIVSIFVTGAATGAMNIGGHAIFIWLFLTPFIIIGLMLAGLLLGYLLRLVLPSSRVMIEPLPPVAGTEAELSWEIAPSRFLSPREITLRLHAEWKESDHHDPSLPRRKPWSAMLWTGTVSRGARASGTEKITLPDPRRELSPLVLAALNWSLVLHATIPLWMNMNDEWPLEFEVPEIEPPAPSAAR